MNKMEAKQAAKKFMNKLLSTTKEWWTVKYLADWLIAILIIAIEGIITTFVVDPHVRILPDGYQDAKYPLLPDIVSTTSLILFAIFLPILVFILAQFIYRSTHDLHHSILSLFQAICINQAITDLIKYIAGRYRPDWYARVETGGSKVLEEGRLSFPSGHSSLSFAGMVILSLYLAGKLGLFRKNGGQLWKGVVVIAPLIGAALVAVSRTRDYHHEFSDIIAGSIIGASCGYFAYHLNFHPVSSKHSHRPKTRIENAPNDNADAGDVQMVQNVQKQDDEDSSEDSLLNNPTHRISNLEEIVVDKEDKCSNDLAKDNRNQVQSSENRLSCSVPLGQSVKIVASPPSIKKSM